MKNSLRYPETSLPGAIKEKGFVLITALIILLVLTILGIALFRGFGLEQKIAGNTREKTRARNAAQSAVQYAEWWLMQGNNATRTEDCDSLLNANLNQGAVCTNPLAQTTVQLTQVPWAINGTPVGTIYTPPGFVLNGLSGGANTYYAAPRFYIYLVGSVPNSQGLIYRIDAVGYGGTPDAVAVIEANFELGTGVNNLGAE